MELEFFFGCGDFKFEFVEKRTRSSTCQPHMGGGGWLQAHCWFLASSSSNACCRWVRRCSPAHVPPHDLGRGARQHFHRKKNTVVCFCFALQFATTHLAPQQALAQQLLTAPRTPKGYPRMDFTRMNAGLLQWGAEMCVVCVGSSARLALFMTPPPATRLQASL